MKKPPEVSVNIRAECKLYPSEDSARVIVAVGNILNNCNPNLMNGYVVATAKNTESLRKIYEHARSRAILGVFRRILERNSSGNTTWFYLNKQAAFVGIVAICEQESESPLGPIKVTITSDQVLQIINWLTS